MLLLAASNIIDQASSNQKTKRGVTALILMNILTSFRILQHIISDVKLI